jgi:hypothetical protein
LPRLWSLLVVSFFSPSLGCFLFIKFGKVSSSSPQCFLIDEMCTYRKSSILGPSNLCT